MQSNWWFVPEKLNDTLTKLILPPDEIHLDSKEIKKASPLTIYLHSVYVTTSRDSENRIRSKFKERRGTTNDIFICTTHKTGNTTKVQRIHYYKQKEPAGKLLSNFFDSVIYSASDFKNDIITLNLQVYDIDNYDKYKDILSAIAGMGNSLAVNFPALSPFTAVAVPGVSGILSLVDNIDSHDKIIDDSLRIEIGEPNTGLTLLQTGNYVYFSEPQDDGLQFSNTKIVVDSSGNSFSTCDYAVISIRATEIQEINDWEKDQKAAKLMSELQGKGSSGKAAVDFVKDTVEGYNNFRKLQRIQELQNKKDITPEEKVLLDKLTNEPELKPYLPK
jgi:hypothetical protein